MSTAGRKRKQLLQPRQIEHRSPAKRSTGQESVGAGLKPLADYDLSTEIKPDLTEQQLPMAARPVATPKPNLDLQQESDSDEEGYEELNQSMDQSEVFCPVEEDPYDPDWSDEQLHARSIFTFNLNQTGLKAGKNSSASPLYYFNLMLGQRQKFFGLLAQSCNRRLKNKKAPPFTEEEMEIFVGLTLVMSEMKLCDLSDYWNSHYYPGFKGFQEKMSLERFQQLMQVLNFDLLDPEDDLGVGDAGPLCHYFNDRMAELYVCGQQLILNDPLILWKSKICNLRDLPEKLRLNSLMLHLLTEQNGLIFKILPEIVHRSQADSWIRNSRQLVEHRNKLALSLIEDKQEGRTVYVSKFYGSFGLAQELAKFQIYCTGLLDRNRYGNSKSLVHEELTPNSIATLYAQPLMMAKWRRRQKSMYFFSSDCLAIYAKEMSMQKTNGRPKLLQEIDWQLGANQQSRQHLIHYQPSWSSLQWDKKLAIYLINLMLYNSYLLYTSHVKPAKSYKDFRITVIKSLLKEELVIESVAPTAEERKQTQTKPAAAATAAPKVQHQMKPIEQQGKPARKNCRHCHKAGMFQYTKFMCNSCPDKPGLCPKPCFQLWHEQQQPIIN